MMRVAQSVNAIAGRTEIGTPFCITVQLTKENKTVTVRFDSKIVWLTTGTTHGRAEKWRIVPTEWVHVLLKPWNFFDET